MPTLTTPTIWTEKVRNAWSLPRPITVSEWANKHRILDPMISGESGQWRTSRTPYLQGVMDAFTDPLVEEITIEASTQVGKTESLFNMLGYCIDEDPGPAMVVFPREPDAKTVSKRRVMPMIRLSPTLRRHITLNSDDFTKMELALDNMIVYFAGANSPAALSQKSIRYLFFDETDKYPKFSGEEADPIELARERTRVYWNRKIIKCSTPTVQTGYIHREYESSDQRSYYVPCPHCHGSQTLEFGQIKIPKGERDPDLIKIKRLAWYECVYCKKKITDVMKPKMLQAGIWLPEYIKPSPKGKLPQKMDIKPTSHAGFHLNALYSPWLTFSEIMAKFLKSKDRIELLMNFVNSWLAQIWQDKTEETKPNQLRRLCSDYRMGVVPDGGIVLTAGVDVQKAYFVVTVRAWGAYPRSWLIWQEVVSKWDDVIEIMMGTDYPSALQNVQPFRVRLACIDTGYNTSEVYDVCRQRELRQVFRPIKGLDQLSGIPYKMSTIDKYPGSGKRIQGGLQLWLLDTTYFKDKVSSWVHADKQVWHLPRNIDDRYVRWFCGEHKVLKRDKRRGRVHEVWEQKTASTQAHFWDTEIYSVAAAEMLYIFNLKDEDKPQPVTQQPGADKPDKPSWVGRRSGWIRRNG